MSEKIIRLLMRDDGLNAKSLRRRCYSSYLGEISTAAENIVNRDFTADKPNQKWLTDISEFAIASGKLYLSIIRDCYNDEIISWKIAEEHLPDLPMQLLKMLFKSKQQVHYNPFRQRMSLQIA